MKKIMIVFLALNTIFLSGCWDMRELNELGLVMAVGIDKAKGSENFIVTAQIAKPQSAASQGGKGGGGGGEPPVWIGTGEGKTIFEAIRNLAKTASRRVMWAHNNIIVIGKSLAEEDITPVVDFFTHNPELRMKTWVAVSHEDAAGIVSAQTGIENIPGISVAELFRYHQLPSESIASDMLHVFSDFKSESRQPLLSIMRIKKGQKSGGREEIELSGAAIFKGSKMIGETSPEETRGLAFIRKETKDAVIVVSGFEGEKQKASVELKNTKINIKSEIKADMPNITISLTTDGSVAEEDKVSNMTIEELKIKVGAAAGREIEREIRMGIDKVQRGYKSDVLGLGRVVHIQHKEEWYKSLKERWDDIYPQIPITINASVNITDSVLYQQPMKDEKINGGISGESKDK